MASRLIKTKRLYNRLQDSLGHQRKGAVIKIGVKVAVVAHMLVHLKLSQYRALESDCQDPKSDCQINFKSEHPFHEIRIDTSSIMEMDRGTTAFIALRLGLSDRIRLAEEKYSNTCRFC